MDDLTRKVIRFQRTGKDLAELTETTAIFIYSLLKKRCSLENDDRSDFFCTMYPEIPVLFHRFHYRGKPFSYFLLAILKWKIRSFIIEKQQKQQHRDYFERESHWNLPFWLDTIEVHEPEPELSCKAKTVFQMDEIGALEDPVLQRRMLMLTMKGSMHIDNHIARCVSIVTGYKSEWILARIQSLKETVMKRCERIDELRSKRNKYYVKIFNIHIELVFEVYPWKRDLLFEKLSLYKHRMKKIIDEIGKIPMTPTHNEIAKVLDAPKGSVDSSLYYLKNSFHTGL